MAKRIKNYAAAKKIMSEYFAKEREALENSVRVTEKSFNNKRYWDEEFQCYRLAEHCRIGCKGGVCTEDDVENAHDWLEKILPGQIMEWENRFEQACSAPRLIELNIRVEWKRSRIWGSNPHASTWICFEDPVYGSASYCGKGSASGCGYDKRSSAVSESLWFSPLKRDTNGVKAEKARAKGVLDRFVIEHGPELWVEYAVDRTPFPHFCFGGKGMNTFTRLFRRIGCHSYDEPVKDYLIDYNESDRGADVYHIIRKDRV